MMHRSDFIKVNGFQNLIYPEDYHFAFKVYYFNIDIVTTPKVIHFGEIIPKEPLEIVRFINLTILFPLKSII